MEEIYDFEETVSERILDLRKKFLETNSEREKNSLKELEQLNLRFFRAVLKRNFDQVVHNE